MALAALLLAILALFTSFGTLCYVLVLREGINKTFRNVSDDMKKLDKRTRARG